MSGLVLTVVRITLVDAVVAVDLGPGHAISEKEITA